MSYWKPVVFLAIVATMVLGVAAVSSWKYGDGQQGFTLAALLYLSSMILFVRERRSHSRGASGSSEEPD